MRRSRLLTCNRGRAHQGPVTLVAPVLVPVPMLLVVPALPAVPVVPVLPAVPVFPELLVPVPVVVSAPVLVPPGEVDSVAGLNVPGPPFSSVVIVGRLASAAEFACCSEPPQAARVRTDETTNALEIWIILPVPILRRAKQSLCPAADCRRDPFRRSR
jgi:hypothetical protein